MHFSTRAWPSRVAAALALTAALSASPSYAGFFDDLFGSKDDVRLEKWAASPDDTFKWGEWDVLRIEPREASGAPNAQPVQLTADQIEAAISGIRIQGFKEAGTLFSEDEVRRFAPAIAVGLAKANAGQDLVFVSTGQHAWSGLMAPVLSNSGRFFFADGRLNLILGSAHQDFLSDLRQGSRQPPKFDLGSRTKSSKVTLLGVAKGNAKLLRQNWIAIAVTESAAPAQNAVSAPAASKASATSSADTFYSKQEARLRALQRMRDQGLITDAEFQQKRAEILKSL